MAGFSKNPLNGLGDNLRTRYDEAFLHNEIVNMRQQVTVLHDTLLAFMDKVERKFALHEAEHRRIVTRLARVEQHCKSKPGLTTTVIRTSIKPQLPSSSPSRSDFGARSSFGLDIKPHAGVDRDGNINQYLASFPRNGAQASDQASGVHIPEDEDGSIVDEDADVGDSADYDGSHEGDETAEDYEEGVPGGVREKRRHTFTSPSAKRFAQPQGTDLNWDDLETEAKSLIGLPERKGKGGKVSGRLGPDSPAWTHYLRTAIQRHLGDEAIARYAREGSRVFRTEQADFFGDAKERVIEFCQRNGIIPPEHKLMEEISWAFLRNKKRYRAGLYPASE